MDRKCLKFKLFNLLFTNFIQLSTVVADLSSVHAVVDNYVCMHESYLAHVLYCINMQISKLWITIRILPFAVRSDSTDSSFIRQRLDIFARRATEVSDDSGGSAYHVTVYAHTIPMCHFS